MTMPYDCGVPLDKCRGAVTSVHVNRAYKAHGSADEARRCARRWVAAVNAANPDGPILLIGKPQRLKKGKPGKEGGQSRRMMLPSIR